MSLNIFYIAAGFAQIFHCSQHSGLINAWLNFGILNYAHVVYFRIIRYSLKSLVYLVEKVLNKVHFTTRYGRHRVVYR